MPLSLRTRAGPARRRPAAAPSARMRRAAMVGNR